LRLRLAVVRTAALACRGFGVEVMRAGSGHAFETVATQGTLERAALLRVAKLGASGVCLGSTLTLRETQAEQHDRDERSYLAHEASDGAADDWHQTTCDRA